jgi:hypothetical protein
MDEDDEMACWQQLQNEQERFEYEQQLLQDDPAFEEWLEATEVT